MELPLLKLHEFWPSQQLSATNCYPPPLLGLWSIVTLSCRAANHCKTQLSLRLRVAVDREWIFIQNLSKESLSLCNTPRKDKFLFMVLTRSQKPQKKTWNKSQESSVKSSAEDSVFLTLIQPACCSSRHFNYHFAHMLVQWPGWPYAGRPSMIPASTYDLRLSTAVHWILQGNHESMLTMLSHRPATFKTSQKVSRMSRWKAHWFEDSLPSLSESDLHELTEGKLFLISWTCNSRHASAGRPIMCTLVGAITALSFTCQGMMWRNGTSRNWSECSIHCNGMQVTKPPCLRIWAKSSIYWLPKPRHFDRSGGNFLTFFLHWENLVSWYCRGSSHDAELLASSPARYGQGGQTWRPYSLEIRRIRSIDFLWTDANSDGYHSVRFILPIKFHHEPNVCWSNRMLHLVKLSGSIWSK